jgi:hypothetical protein
MVDNPVLLGEANMTKKYKVWVAQTVWYSKEITADNAVHAADLAYGENLDLSTWTNEGEGESECQRVEHLSE